MKIELMVFGIIAVFVVLMSLFFKIPESKVDQSNLPNLGKAPELVGNQGWINSQPLKISDLKDVLKRFMDGEKLSKLGKSVE